MDAEQEDEVAQFGCLIDGCQSASRPIGNRNSPGLIMRSGASGDNSIFYEPGAH
jgi:hypothetical protein